VQRLLNGDKKKDWKKLYSTDLSGQQVLDLEGVPPGECKEIWYESPLRKELLKLFPDFDAMREFAKERFLPSAFQRKLLKRIDATEEDYIDGSINFLQVTKRLSHL